MFVVMALVVTFATTPLTTYLYPKWYQTKVERWRRGEIDWDGNPLQPDGRVDSVAVAKDKLKSLPVRRLLVYLRLDGLSGICTLAALLGPSRISNPPVARIHPGKVETQENDQTVEDCMTAAEVEDNPALQVHGVRLMELTDRDSSVMKVSQVDEFSLWDPVVNTFRAFGQWHDISIRAGVSVVPEYSYADTVVGMAHDDAADLLLIPWSETGALADSHSGFEADETNRFANGTFVEFVSSVLDRVPNNVGIFVERNVYTRAKAKGRPAAQRSISAMSIRGSIWNNPPVVARSHHLVLPFFGGEDDRLAARFVLQLAQNDQVTATIIHVDAPILSETKSTVQITAPTIISSSSASPRSNSTEEERSDSTYFATLCESLPTSQSSRVVFRHVTANVDTVAAAVAIVKEEMDQMPHKAGNIVVVGRRNNRVDQVAEASQEEFGLETRKALGAVGEAMVRSGSQVVGHVLVLQAGNGSGSN